MYNNKYLKYKQKYLNLKKIYTGLTKGGSNPVLSKYCKIDELMSNLDYENECINNSVVTGSCGDPSFRDNALTDITQIQCEEYINIFNRIIRRTSDDESTNIQYLDIILGPSEYFESDFRGENTLKLFISPDTRFEYYVTLYEKILDNPLRGQILFLNSFFPLNYNTKNNKRVLDKILEINNDHNIKVRITNRMCGTCHRSLYYLVKNGIDYLVNPEQGLGPADTEPIKYCFKNIIKESLLRDKHKIFLDLDPESEQQVQVYDLFPAYAKYNM